MLSRISAVALTLALTGLSVSAWSTEDRGPAFTASPVEEQQSLELLRASIRMEKRDILKSALGLSEKDYERFWPIYYAYQAQLIRIYDRKLNLIKGYAEGYEKITEKDADKLVKESFSATKAQTALLEKYYAQVAKAFSKSVGARFVQVENALNGAFDLKLRSSLPLVPKVPASASPKP
jgi:hypothetical protein